MNPNTFYFRHDCNARNDERCAALRARHGAEAYGILWMLIEVMHESTTGELNANLLDGFCLANGIQLETLKQVVDTCIEIGIFQQKGTAIFSQRVLDQKRQLNELIQKRREAGRLGGLTKAKCLASAKHLPSKIVANSTKGKERKGEETKEHIAADAAPDVIDEKESEFRKFIPIVSQIFRQEKKFTDSALSKWKARRKKFSAREIGEAFLNLQHEPDLWKIKNNGFRELSWWLHSDDRIREMQNCHLKRSTSRPLHVAG